MASSLSSVYIIFVKNYCVFYTMGGNRVFGEGGRREEENENENEF